MCCDSTTGYRRVSSLFALIRFALVLVRGGGLRGLAAATLLHRAGLGVVDVEDDGLVVGLADALDGAVVDLVLGGVVQLEERADGDEHGRGLDADGAGLLVGGLAELDGVLLVRGAGLDGDLLGGFVDEHAHVRGVAELGGGGLVEADRGAGDGHDGLAGGCGQRNLMKTLQGSHV